jgi:hypothetical protein
MRGSSSALLVVSSAAAAESRLLLARGRRSKQPVLLSRFTRRRALCAASAASQLLRSPLNSSTGWKRPHCWQNLCGLAAAGFAGQLSTVCIAVVVMCKALGVMAGAMLLLSKMRACACGCSRRSLLHVLQNQCMSK